MGEGNASFGSGYGGTSLSGGTPASVKEEVESFPLRRSEAARVAMSNRTFCGDELFSICAVHSRSHWPHVAKCGYCD